MRVTNCRSFRIALVLFGLLLIPPRPAFSEDIPPELEVEAAVHLAVRNHPALAAAAASVGGSEGLLEQSQVRPNPIFTAQTENWRFSGEPSFEVANNLDLFLFVTQPVERGRKRHRRAELASQDLEIANLRLAELEWRIKQNVRSSFWKAFLAQQEEELLRENARVFGEVTRYHEDRVREGAMAEVDLIRVRLEEEKLRLQEGTAALQTHRAKVELARAMGLQSFQPGFHLRAEVQPLGEGGIHLSELRARALRTRPDVTLAEALVELARRAAALEVARATPDWDLTLGYKRTEGFNTLLAGLNVPLPIFDTNAGNIRAGYSEVERSEALLRERRQSIQAEVESAVSLVSRQLAFLDQVEREMLQRAQNLWEIAQAAYQEGASDLLRLLDAQRSLNEVRVIHNRSKLEIQVGIVHLEEAVGSERLSIGRETFRVRD